MAFGELFVKWPRVMAVILLLLLIYILIACRNSLTSQEVVDFVRSRIAAGNKTLSVICEDVSILFCFPL